MLVFALVSVAMPVADAAAHHAPVVAHWEDASDESCPPQHDASTCQVCQSAVRWACASVAVRIAVAPTATRRPTEQTRVAIVAAPSRGVPASRAPPGS